MTTAHDPDRVAALIEKWRAEADVSDALVDAGEITPQVAEHERGTAFASRLCADELEAALAVPVEPDDSGEPRASAVEAPSVETLNRYELELLVGALSKLRYESPIMRALLVKVQRLSQAKSATQALAAAGEPVSVNVSDIHDGEEQEGPYDSTDLFLEGRGIRCLVNYKPVSGVTFTVRVDGENVKSGRIGPKVATAGERPKDT